MGRAAKVARAAAVGRVVMVRRAASAASGFTLLEMVVTLAVLALAIAVVTPAIGRGTESLRARAEVASFAATLRHARERAIATQRPYRVAVDSDSHRVVVTPLPGLGVGSPIGPVSSARSASSISGSTNPASTGSANPTKAATGSGRATTSRGTGPTSGAEALSTADPDGNVTRTLSPTFVIESAKPAEVIFDMRGGASGGDFKLTSGGVTYRVTVDRLSGRVRSIRE